MVIRMRPRSVRYTAGTAQLVPGAVLLIQLLIGGVVSCMGLTTDRMWLVPLGASIMVAGLLFMLRRGVILPGRPVIAAGDDGLYLHPCTGQPLNEKYGWLEQVGLTSDWDRPMLLLQPKDPGRWVRRQYGAYRRRAVDHIRRYGAPVALSKGELDALCSTEVSLEALRRVIDDNRIYHEVNGFGDESLLTTRSLLESGAPLFHAGEEARLCSAGICARIRREEGVFLFPLAELDCVASMADYCDGSRKIVLVLAFRGGTMFGLLDSDPLFSALFEYIWALPGFDQWTFRRSISPVNDQLLYCYQRRKQNK